MEDWSGKGDLNPRPSPWQGDALPLSYSRSWEGRSILILVRLCYPVKKTRTGERAISMDNHGGLSLLNHVHGIVAIVGDGPSLP